MKHFVVYDLATGNVLRAGTCLDQDLEAQAQPGEGVIEASADSVIVAEVNLDPVRNSLMAKIDAEAEDVRGRFITPGAGQAMTYLRKEAEAKAWLADHNAATPFLTAEAASTGTTVALLAADVAARAAAWSVIGPKIEAARLGAKKAVKAATNIGQMHAAATVNWQAVIS